MQIIRNVWQAVNRGEKSMIAERRKDLLACVPMVPLFFIVANISTIERAFVAVVSIYMFYVVISEKWSSRRSWTFWINILVFALVHIFVITMVRLPTSFKPALAVLPIAVGDVFLMYGTINIIERTFLRSGTNHVE
jgi:uncharacterized membrane-anchored protein